MIRDFSRRIGFIKILEKFYIQKLERLENFDI